MINYYDPITWANVNLTSEPTAEEFNAAMFAVNCPIRAVPHVSNMNACYLAAFVWLASRALEQQK